MCIYNNFWNITNKVRVDGLCIVKTIIKAFVKASHRQLCKSEQLGGVKAKLLELKANEHSN